MRLCFFFTEKHNLFLMIQACKYLFFIFEFWLIYAIIRKIENNVKKVSKYVGTKDENYGGVICKLI